MCHSDLPPFAAEGQASAACCPRPGRPDHPSSPNRPTAPTAPLQVSAAEEQAALREGLAQLSAGMDLQLQLKQEVEEQLAAGRDAIGAGAAAEAVPHQVRA